MTPKEAEQTLAVIRTLMERGTRYTNLSGHAGIAAGALTLAGCALRVWLNTPFLATWIGVLIAASGANVFFTAALARSSGEPFWTRQTRTVVLALMPAFVSALVLTAVLTRVHQEALLPGVWMLLWGSGALAMSFFTPRVLSLLGVTFLIAGTLTLFLEPGSDAFSMGLTFGAIHLVYGIVLSLVRQSTCAQWSVFRHLC
jgi:multisubunit Na+/H+ antiporter MnhC subunit